MDIQLQEPDTTPMVPAEEVTPEVVVAPVGTPVESEEAPEVPMAPVEEAAEGGDSTEA
ncbi:MAG: hypothetical protein NUV96_02510 [Candidatus Colwellbacteria bacterium]|nr:hypothetical protein [Candidatus Colwellbacteria bacterium]